MAIPGLNINDKQKQRLRKEKFAPLGSRFQNQLQLERATNQRTAGVIRPKLQALTEEGQAERNAHAGRVQDLGQTYNYQGQATNEAYDRAQQALDRVLTTSATANTVNQSTLAAALAKSRQSNLDQANAVGGVLPPSNAPETEQGIGALGAMSLGSLGQSIGTNLASAAGSIGRVAQGRTRAFEDESQRSSAKLGEVQKAKTGVKKETPAVKEEQREALENSELAKATERSREKIARGSLGLEGKKLQEETKQHHAENAISWGSINAEKEKFKAEIELATGESGKKRAEAQAAKYNAGVSTFQSYLSGHKPNQVVPADLYRALTLSCTPKMALSIMSHTTNQEILGFVSKHGGGKKTPPKKPQGPYKGAHPGTGVE